MNTRRCRGLAWSFTALVTAVLCYSLVHIPIQVTDSLIPILDAQRTGSVTEAIANSSGSTAYLRPLRIGQIQAVFELSNGNYFLAFRGFHVMLAIACLALFVLALDIRSPAGLAALPFALTVLTGLHTFRGTVWEAFPINHFLEIVICGLLALILAQSKGGWKVDAAGAVVFVFAALTLESGLLVWVLIVVSWLVGMRGFSRRGVVAVTGLLAAYVFLRFFYLGSGTPTLIERSAGFGLRQLGTDELVSRFGEWPYGFYAYNVVSSLLSVLFAEPRAGVWTIPAEFVSGRITVGTLMNVVSSTLTTALIIWFFVRRVPAWRTREFQRADQIVLVALAVLCANALMSYAYTKDEIMSPAGAFYALAAFVAVRDALQWASRPDWGRNIAVAALGLVLAVSASGWGLRSIGLHYQMQAIALSDRNEWVGVDEWLRSQRAFPATAEGQQLVERLRHEAFQADALSPYVVSPLWSPRFAQVFR